MNLNELLNIKVRTNPDSLLKLLVRVAVVSIVIVVVVSGYGFYRLFSGFVIKNAENNSVQLCQVLIDQQKELLFVAVPGRAVEIGLHGTEILAFDLSLRNYLTPFSIIKVKVYNANKKIVYSTDPMLIGKVDQSNQRLNRALAGKVDAKLVTKDKATDLLDEELRDVDVVETYVPILNQDNKVLGSFEVYMNTTGYREQIRRGAAMMTSLLTLALVGVFGFSYLLIRGSAVQLREAQAQLEITAITDPLTGIHNRGYLMKRGEDEFERVRRHSDPDKFSLGCIMIDLDHFKRINDTKGHLAGDGVLKSVAGILNSNARLYDIVGRYGGEEFVVLLPDAAFEQTLEVANRICEKVRRAPFDVDGEMITVTVSLGVSGYSKADGNLNDLIKRADAGLYKAKADGRDRVAWVGLDRRP